MSNDIQAYGGNTAAAVATVDPAEIERVVAKMIFPNSTPEERQVFYHRCKMAGVHPLSMKISPVKYNSRDGVKLTFIVGIDVMRSRAMETGLYDGCDDVEYDGSTTVTCDGKAVEVPEEAVIRVYRKDVSRPFVGRARWVEFYPGETRGKMWREKPYIMLAKCAEAQAYRKAFPEVLEKLYVSDEMEMAIDNDGNPAQVSRSTKPRVLAAQVVVTDAPEAKPAAVGGGADAVKPPAGNADNYLRGMVEDYKVTAGESNGKAWVRHGVKINGVIYGTFDGELGATAELLLGQPVLFTAADNGKHRNLLSIEAAEPEASNE